jgi:hypothetical protein
MSQGQGMADWAGWVLGVEEESMASGRAVVVEEVDLQRFSNHLGRFVPPDHHASFLYPCLHVLGPHCAVYCLNALLRRAYHIHPPR